LLRDLLIFNSLRELPAKRHMRDRNVFELDVEL
jgi:hypothetical protein